MHAHPANANTAVAAIEQPPQEDQDLAVSDLSEEDNPPINQRPPVRASTGNLGQHNPRKPSPPTQVFDEDELEDDESREVLPPRTGPLVVQKKATQREVHENEGVFSDFCYQLISL